LDDLSSASPCTPFPHIFGEYRVRRPQDLARAVLEEILKPERTPRDIANAALADILKSARSLEELAEAVAKHILKSEHTHGDVATVVGKHILKLELTPQDLGRIWARLDDDITKSERAYWELGQAKEHLQNQRPTRAEPSEKFKQRLVEAYERVLLAETRCQFQDQPLKSILYAMEATAVCLSGGGIRSASFRSAFSRDSHDSAGGHAPARRSPCAPQNLEPKLSAAHVTLLHPVQRRPTPVL
jgi:hypothetical protein